MKFILIFVFVEASLRSDFVSAFSNIHGRITSYSGRSRHQRLSYSIGTPSPVEVVSSDANTSRRTKLKESGSNTLKRRLPMTRPKSLTSSPKSEATTTFSRTKKNTPDLLTKEEERDLANEIRRLRTILRIRDELINSNISDGSDGQRSPNESEWAEACGMSVDELRQVILQGQESRSKMVAANGGLVGSIAKRYYNSVMKANQANGGMGSILSYHDLVQEGNLGLMEAAERFEPERGFRFSTYATWWVRQRMLRAISDYSRIIRLPAHVHQMIRKIQKARKDIEQDIRRQPSNLELAHYLGITEEKLEMYSGASRTVLSLEHPVRGLKTVDDSTTLGDFISSDSPTPDEDAESRSLREVILSVVDELPMRERDVLIARFGLDDGTPKNVAETSKILGLSRDRVRAIEARALNNLRHPQRNHKLKSYVGGDLLEEHAEEETMELSPEQIWSF